MEDVYPGMWQRWFKNQCAAVGWAADWRYKLHGRTRGGHGWITARNALNAMRSGDYLLVALRGNRIGRIGQITEKAVEDKQWNPLVPPGPELDIGEMGRRILVRWDLTVGPSNEDLVVQLPSGETLSKGEVRSTISRIRSRSLAEIRRTMNDPVNWVNLLGGFVYEKALSDFIANYPNRLEDGLLPHPNSKIRERIFKDKTRLDVLLIDRQDNPVIVECKQHAPRREDIKQLRHYMQLLKNETKRRVRGLLVHGGAAKLSTRAIREALHNPAVELINYELAVAFRPSLLSTARRPR